MSWGKFWLMPDFGSDDYHRRLRDLQRSAALSGKEIDQDEQIENLRHENRELKLYTAGLLQLLVNKGTLTADEVLELVRLVERAEQETQRAESANTSPDLEAIARAAKQVHR
jgi:hypothetical protein